MQQTRAGRTCRTQRRSLKISPMTNANERHGLVQILLHSGYWLGRETFTGTLLDLPARPEHGGRHTFYSHLAMQGALRRRRLRSWLASPTPGGVR
jgi:hypothetical protein